MVATLRIRQLQSDVNDLEEAELRRLEHGATAGGDGEDGEVAMDGAHREDSEEVAACANGQRDEEVGVVVHGAVQRAEQLDSKMFTHGGFRDSHRIIGLQPKGSASLKTKVPKRKNFGAEGDEGDAAHSAAMNKSGGRMAKIKLTPRTLILCGGGESFNLSPWRYRRERACVVYVSSRRVN